MSLRQELKAATNAEIVTVGAGPVGLMVNIGLAEVRKDIPLVMLERHSEYKRLQRLRLNMDLVTNPRVKKSLIDLLNNNQAKRLDEHHIDIPIQVLENCLLSHAKRLGINIVYKQFMTAEQFAAQLTEHKLNNQKELEEKLGQEVVVDAEQIKALFPNCKIIIGADGARSSVRDLISDEDEKISKKDLRNMIEVKYQVKGEVHKLSVVEAPLTQTLLDGYLCSEHVKYNPEKDVTDVTLTMLVDEKTFNHPALNGVNAKNLLPITDNIPKKLKKAINMWVQTRNDKDIVLGSPTINKTTLSVYTSKKYCEAINDMTILLVGDASCGFPFMNGLNLGVENGDYLVQKLLSHWNKIKLNDLHALHALVEDYSAITQGTFEKGSKLVNQANKKIKFQESSVSVMHNSSLAIVYSVQYLRSADHEIFSAHSPFNFTELQHYISHTMKAKEKRDLAKNLFSRLSQCSMDFEYIKSVLYSAYLENREIELTAKRNPLSSFFSSTLSFKSMFSKSVAEKESKANNLGYIPEVLTSTTDKTMLSQGLHKIIYNMYKRITQFEQYYQAKCKDMLKSSYGDNVAEIVRGYLSA